MVLETVDSNVDVWLDVLPDELEIVELWDVTEIGTDVVVATEDSVVTIEVCAVGFSAELTVTEEVSERGSVVEVITIIVEVGASCEVGIDSEVIVVGTEGSDSVEGVEGALCVAGVVGATVELSICRIRLFLGTKPPYALAPDETRLTTVTNRIVHNTTRRSAN